jgi:hypothetical protein
MIFAPLVRHLAAYAIVATAVFVGRVSSAAPDLGFDTKLPTLPGLVRLSDGAWVASCGAAAYVSESDLKDWSLLRTGIPDKCFISQCLGGSRKRTYFVASTDSSLAKFVIYAVVPGQDPTIIRSLPPLAQPPAAFCSETTGAISTGANVGVTVDGGVTWHPNPPLFTADGARIILVQRVDDSRLLVSDGRSLVLAEVRPDATLREIWRISPPDGVGTVQVPISDATHAWLFTGTGLSRLKLMDGEADIVVPKGAIDFHDANRVVVVWDNAIIAWSRRRQCIRALTPKADIGYTLGHWFPANACVVLPSVKPHCLTFGVRGEAYDFDIAADTFTPITLHVRPPTPKPPQPSPVFNRLMDETAKLGLQLQRVEANAIGERVMKRKDLTPEQQLALLKDEYEAAINKHKADGTLNPPAKPLIVQIVELGKQLPNDEVSRAWDDARRKERDTTKQWELVRDQLKKLVAKHAAEGTLRIPGAAEATDRPQIATPNARPAEANAIPESPLEQISRLSAQLPDKEVQQVYVDARLNGPNDPAQAREWVKRRLEKLVAKHKADGTLVKPEEVEPVPGNAPPDPNANALPLEILRLGQQLPEDEVKQVWVEARRKERDQTKQWEIVRDQLRVLVAKHADDGTLQKPKSDPPPAK